MAESWFQLGEPDKGEALFRNWLKEDPEWGWGWIGWSDCYWHLDEKIRNPEKAETLLKQGLAVPGVRDRQDILDRLANINADTCRKSGAEKICKQTPETEKTKVGRNEPCPCGNGKKYKKCCLDKWL